MTPQLHPAKDHHTQSHRKSAHTHGAKALGHHIVKPSIHNLDSQSCTVSSVQGQLQTYTCIHVHITGGRRSVLVTHLLFTPWVMSAHCVCMKSMLWYCLLWHIYLNYYPRSLLHYFDLRVSNNSNPTDIFYTGGRDFDCATLSPYLFLSFSSMSLIPKEWRVHMSIFFFLWFITLPSPALVCRGGTAAVCFVHVCLCSI